MCHFSVREILNFYWLEVCPFGLCFVPRECPSIERAEIGHKGWRIFALDIYPILVVACSGMQCRAEWLDVAWCSAGKGVSASVDVRQVRTCTRVVSAVAEALQQVHRTLYADAAPP